LKPRKEKEMTAKFIDAIRALLTVTRAHAASSAAAHALHMMPVPYGAASLLSRL
jgi:hypothetical protein